MVSNAKGWLKVPGIRPFGDRSLEEQMKGLDRALAECKDKTVLDLGCAEGLIGLEFAKAGAKQVLGIELLESHLQIARKACKGWPQMQFVRSHLGEYMLANPQPQQFDIVLALGIIHKLDEPGVLLNWAARSAKTLLCFRAPAHTEKKGDDYFVKSKFTDARCNVPATMRKHGFVDEGIFVGVRGEAVQYWRKAA